MLMDRIRLDVNNGYLNREDYLTARFNIPNALVTGEARQGGRIRDIFGEPFELNQPLENPKHDKVVHKIRPVEAYVIDDQGREIMMDESPIRSAPWRPLRKNGPGVAEMPALLGDMAGAPEGDGVMDPSIIFMGEGSYGGGDVYDSYQDQAIPEGMYDSNHGFHNIDDVDPIEYPPYCIGSGRAIKGISLGLFNPSATVPSQLRDSSTTVWVPRVTAWNDTNKGTAYCGWETNTGTKGGTIWRYDREDAYKDFIPPHPLLTFLAPQSAGVSKVTSRYPFSISTGSASLTLISSTDIAGGPPSNGKNPFRYSRRG